MRRRKQGQFATFAMLIPMFAVPVMAVFGIPQFAPVVASPASQQQPDWLSDNSFDRIGQSDAFPSRSLNLVAAESEQLDLFQPFAANEQPALTSTRNQTAAERRSDPLRSDHGAALAETTAASASNPPVLDLFAPVGAADPSLLDINEATAVAAQRTAESRTAESRSAQPQRLSAPANTQRPAQSRTSRTRVAAQPDETSWRGAVNRLNQLGIRTYRLSPSTGDGRYHFMCLVTSADDPRISRRFEAESREPLDAVDRVLAQVEEWNRIR